MCLGKVYLQSMIMVSVSLSLASWNGAAPHTSMYRITPSDQMSERIFCNDWIEYLMLLNLHSLHMPELEGHQLIYLV